MSACKKSKLGVFLGKYRIEIGVSQCEMAEKIGMAASNLSAIENGAVSVPRTFYDKFVAAYPLDANMLEEFKRIISECVSTRTYNKRSIIRDWAEMTYKMLNDDQRREFLETVKKIEAKQE